MPPKADNVKLADEEEAITEIRPPAPPPALLYLVLVAVSPPLTLNVAVPAVEEARINMVPPAPPPPPPKLGLQSDAPCLTNAKLNLK